MRRMLVGISAALISIAAYATPPPMVGAPVTVQNVPLPVSVSNTPTVTVGNSPTVTVGNTVLVATPAGAALPVAISGEIQAIKEVQVFGGVVVMPPGGVPSMVSPSIFQNTSATAAMVHAYVSHQIHRPYVCNGGIRPTAVDVNIWPIGTSVGRAIQLPMLEHLSVRREGVDYCWAEMSDGPFFVPPGFEVRFNIVYTEVPPGPMTVQINVNGYYMK